MSRLRGITATEVPSLVTTETISLVNFFAAFVLKANPDFLNGEDTETDFDF